MYGHTYIFHIVLDKFQIEVCGHYDATYEISYREVDEKDLLTFQFFELGFEGEKNQSVPKRPTDLK